jgi:hypothetical protein
VAPPGVRPDRDPRSGPSRLPACPVAVPPPGVRRGPHHSNHAHACMHAAPGVHAQPCSEPCLVMRSRHGPYRYS